MDGGKNGEDWGQFLMSTSFTEDGSLPEEIAHCPIWKGNYSVDQSRYVFANSENENCFPDGKFTKQLPEKTPIAGDAYDPDEKFSHLRPRSRCWITDHSDPPFHDEKIPTRCKLW